MDYKQILADIARAIVDTPESVIDLSTAYMQIYFSGTIFNMLYNFGSAILRATGDTQRPLYYLTVAGIANVCLNTCGLRFFSVTTPERYRLTNL